LRFLKVGNRLCRRDVWREGDASRGHQPTAGFKAVTNLLPSPPRIRILFDPRIEQLSYLVREVCAVWEDKHLRRPVWIDAVQKILREAVVGAPRDNARQDAAAEPPACFDEDGEEVTQRTLEKMHVVEDQHARGLN